MTQYARPTGLVSNSNDAWQPGAAPGETPKANLWDSINEVTLDTDYFDYATDDGGAGESFEVYLSGVTDPVSSSSHEVHFTVEGDQGEGSFDIILKDGSSTIVTSGISQLDGGGPETKGFALSTSQANSIGDYGDLRLHFTFTDEDFFGEQCNVYHAYFQCPDAPAPAASTNAKAFMLFLDS